MINQFRNFSVLLVLMVVLFIPATYSQLPTYTMTFSNDTVYAPGNVYEVDIWLARTGTIQFQLYGLQLGIYYNNEIRNGGTLTASWVPGSNDPALVATSQVNTSFSTATAGVVKIAPKTQGVYGNGCIIPVTPGLRVGRLRLSSTTIFNIMRVDLHLSYTTVPYKTAVFGFDVTTQLNGEITDTTKNIMDLNNPALPVELTSFQSVINGRQVNLSWETKTEVNFNKFEVERTSGASSTWVQVGSVQASGTSNSTKKYSYTEKNLQAGKYQYRLKMVDNDGSIKFSNAIETEIALPKSFELSQNYPNPFNPSTRINYSLPSDSRITLDVFSITGERIGQLVNEEQSAGYYTVNFSSSALNRSIASGVYIYKINAVDKSNGNVFTSIKKMMLLK